MKEPRNSSPSKPQSKPEEKLDEELEESFPASQYADVCRRARTVADEASHFRQAATTRLIRGGGGRLLHCVRRLASEWGTKG